ncbi:carbohydrate binding domain-containing protein [Streptomyces curacoi]|uniref:Tat pathway signal protein n=1 Tax=Streptomyces curacoi TaxID=146536 RepID=A0A124GZQ3_9ACTN|nr:carbohydrate binding domain-containing protein [Streptomyces curacoi]KUM73277.1 Tat pathway signal protein [Streptomyces curacoi]
MSEPLQRRSLLKLAVGTAATGWLWQGVGTAQAAADATPTTAPPAAGPLDTLVFGNTASESAHGLTATLSDVVTGGLDQPARVLNVPESAGFWGGTLSATMACRPRGATYVTIKLWGSESGAELGRLQLFAEGKQVGHYHLGAVDPLDIASEDPRTPERFFFHTLPLPLDLTEGKESVSLEIRSMGRIAGYATSADSYYKAMEGPSRTVYRLYTHDEPYFALADGDVTGTLPPTTTRTSPGSEIVDTINARILARAASEASRTSPQLDLWYLDFLARAYGMPATAAHANIAVPPQIARSLDGIYWRYRADSAVMTNSSQQWMGLGRSGLVMLALADVLAPLLDEPVLGSPYGLTNPGFEFGTTGWRSSTWSGSGTASRDTTVYRTGHASAKVTVPTAGTVGYTTSARIPVDQGTYTYGGWIRTAGVGTRSAYLDILFHDANGAVVGTDNKVHASAGTHDWEHVTASLTTPGTATHVTLSVRLSGAGTAWFDDLTMVEPEGSAYAPVVRRDAWARMLLDSREYWRQNFPQYTNQAIICAIGLYLADRGLTYLGSADAWGEKKARDYIYQSVGLVPWLGPEKPDGTPTRPLGGSYHQVTKKGISKELGYAGSYGELQEWLSLVYDAVTGIGGVEDGTLRDHLVKMAKARMVFRHPSLDRDGHRAMRLETVVGWRDNEYPGKVAYDQDAKWDGHALKMAAQIKDPDLVSYARQSLADGQAFQSLADSHAATVSARTNLNLLSTADDYAYISKATGSGAKLPMTPGAPDFVFSDEENGLVAIKHGDEILFASLYWRARWGVNRLARVHHLTAEGTERSATVWQEVKYLADGRTFTEPDWVNWEFTVSDLDIPDGGFTPPGNALHQAFAGQVLPLAKAPDDVPERAAGVESPYAGRASFYRCEYGPYLIAMNTTDDRDHTFTTRGFGASTNLVTGAKVSGNTEVRVKPGTTVVLRKR